MIGLFVVALAFTLFFGLRFVGRLRNRPSHDPIRAWQNIIYVARAQGVPPQVLEQALGLPKGPPPDRRPINEIARAQGKTSDEVIQVLETTVARERPPPPPQPRSPGAQRLPTATP